ncbi:SIZ1 [[Candida] subhashii]|uniref:SIZ1 n=1 Tax=[Candida] subhashii TaxID=561895 RepID=A0A8J5UKX1_9ASCO|nr:SIZ1 [[Candida] subhashii]KAG7662401.1 SIZ1 [[Candida] subhashii]
MSNQSNRSLSNEEFTDTIHRLHQMKVAELKDICRSMGCKISGRKSDLVESIETYFRHGKEFDDNIRLLAVRALILKRELGSNLPSYRELYAAIKDGSYSVQSQENQYTRAPAPAERSIHANDSTPHRGHALYFVENPFFRPVRLVHGSPQMCAPSKGRGVCEFSFVLEKEEYRLLQNKESNMRVYLLCGKKENHAPASSDVRIQFPIPSEITVNGTQITQAYRGIKGKLGTAKPADITGFLRPPTSRNTVQLIYQQTTDTYLTYLYIVDPISVDSIMETIKTKPKIHKNSTIERIKAENEDDEIEVSTTTVTLRDPLAYTRMKYPVQSIYCKHTQCFDGYIFLQAQLQMPTWICPYCSRNIKVHDLAISEYFDEIINNVSEDVDNVVIHTDGSWSVSNENAADENNNIKAEQSNALSKSKSASVPPSTIEVVSLSSDEEEENEDVDMDKHVEEPNEDTDMDRGIENNQNAQVNTEMPIGANATEEQQGATLPTNNTQVEPTIPPEPTVEETQQSLPTMPVNTEQPQVYGEPANGRVVQTTQETEQPAHVTEPQENVQAMEEAAIETTAANVNAAANETQVGNNANNIIEGQELVAQDLIRDNSDSENEDLNDDSPLANLAYGRDNFRKTGRISNRSSLSSSGSRATSPGMEAMAVSGATSRVASPSSHIHSPTGPVVSSESKGQGQQQKQQQQPQNSHEVTSTPQQQPLSQQVSNQQNSPTAALSPSEKIKRMQRQYSALFIPRSSVQRQVPRSPSKETFTTAPAKPITTEPSRENEVDHSKDQNRGITTDASQVLGQTQMPTTSPPQNLPQVQKNVHIQGNSPNAATENNHAGLIDNNTQTNNNLEIRRAVQSAHPTSVSVPSTYPQPSIFGKPSMQVSVPPTVSTSSGNTNQHSPTTTESQPIVQAGISPSLVTSNALAATSSGSVSTSSASGHASTQNRSQVMLPREYYVEKLTKLQSYRGRMLGAFREDLAKLDAKHFEARDIFDTATQEGITKLKAPLRHANRNSNSNAYGGSSANQEQKKMERHINDKVLKFIQTRHAEMNKILNEQRTEKQAVFAQQRETAEKVDQAISICHKALRAYQSNNTPTMGQFSSASKIPSTGSQSTQSANPVYQEGSNNHSAPTQPPPQAFRTQSDARITPQTVEYRPAQGPQQPKSWSFPRRTQNVHQSKPYMNVQAASANSGSGTPSLVEQAARMLNVAPRLTNTGHRSSQPSTQPSISPTSTAPPRRASFQTGSTQQRTSQHHPGASLPVHQQRPPQLQNATPSTTAPVSLQDTAKRILEQNSRKHPRPLVDDPKIHNQARPRDKPVTARVQNFQSETANVNLSSNPQQQQTQSPTIDPLQLQQSQSPTIDPKTVGQVPSKSFTFRQPQTVVSQAARLQKSPIEQIQFPKGSQLHESSKSNSEQDEGGQDQLQQRDSGRSSLEDIGLFGPPNQKRQKITGMLGIQLTQDTIGLGGSTSSSISPISGQVGNMTLNSPASISKSGVSTPIGGRVGAGIGGTTGTTATPVGATTGTAATATATATTGAGTGPLEIIDLTGDDSD